MPYTALTVTTSPAWGAGLADAGFEAVDQANGNNFTNDGRTVLLVNNGSGADLDVTINAPAGPHTVNKAQTKVLTIANGDIGVLGPFAPEIFDNAGVVEVDWESGTSVTAAAVKLAQTPGFGRI